MLFLSAWDLEQAGFFKDRAEDYMTITAKMLFPKSSYKAKELVKWNTEFNERGSRIYPQGLDFNSFDKAYDNAWHAGGLFLLLLANSWACSGTKVSQNTVCFQVQNKGGGSMSTLKKIMKEYRPVAHFLAAYVGMFYDMPISAKKNPSELKRFWISNIREFVFAAAGLRLNFMELKIFDGRQLWMPPNWQSLARARTFSPSMPPQEAIEFIKNEHEKSRVSYLEYLGKYK